MEDIQETFTRRILRRALQRRERDRKEAMNRSAEISQRRLNILRAMNDPSMSLVSYSTDTDDRENLDRSYDSFRDSFNVTGNSCNDNNNNEEKSYDGNAKKSSASRGEEEIPILVKVTERNIEVPAKMIAELKKIDVTETANDTFDFTRAKRSSMTGIEAMTKTPERRSLNVLSTEAVVEMCNKVSSMLTDIRHDAVDSSDLKNTDFFATADFEAINFRSPTFKNRPEEFTEENDKSRNKKIPISPETPLRKSAHTESTTEAVVQMCKRVSSVLAEPVDSTHFQSTDFFATADPKVINFRSSTFAENPPEESTEENDKWRNKKIPISPETPLRKSANTESTTEAVVQMCKRVSSVLAEPVDSTHFQSTDFFATAESEAINNFRSSKFTENRPEEFTDENDNWRNKKIPISPESPVRRSVNTLTTEAVVEMCNRVSSVLTDIRCDLSDPRDYRNTDFPRIPEERNFQPRDFIEHQPKESTGRDADFSAKKSAESWDEDKFLKVALGEDRYENLTDEDTDRSDYAGTKPIGDRFPLQRGVIEARNLPWPKTPTNRSFNTLDRSMRICRTLSHRIKNKFRPIFRADRKEETPDEPPTIPRLDDSARIRQLLREVKIQQTIINQSTKALDLCTSLKQFTESTERVESERSLLLASLRGKAALEEIKSITSDETKEEVLSEKGEVTVSEMSLDLRGCLESEQEEIEWFVVVVSHGLRVWATRVANCRSEEIRVNFPGSVSIANLTPGFKILVRVYSLKLGRDAYSDEDKYRRKKTSRKHFWSSSSSVLRRVDITSQSSMQNIVVRSANTSFVLSGCTELVLEDLSVSSPWPLMMVPVDSRLRGSIDLNIACRLRFSISHEGFLNHGDEAGGLATWNRRWCVLRGHTLKFWNYPREEETKEPLKIIELVDCVSDEVTTVDRKICAKPRTLLIETKRSRQPGDRNSIVIECKSACTIVRNLLSYDSARELEEWSRKINEVIVALEEWNVIGKRSQPSEI